MRYDISVTANGKRVIVCKIITDTEHRNYSSKDKEVYTKYASENKKGRVNT